MTGMLRASRTSALLRVGPVLSCPAWRFRLFKEIIAPTSSVWERAGVAFYPAGML